MISHYSLVCKECGSIAYRDHTKNYSICPVCKSTNIAEVEISYAFKLLLDEIKSMGIFPQLIVDKKVNMEW